MTIDCLKKGVFTIFLSWLLTLRIVLGETRVNMDLQVDSADSYSSETSPALNVVEKVKLELMEKAHKVNSSAIQFNAFITSSGPSS